MSHWAATVTLAVLLIAVSLLALAFTRGVALGRCLERRQARAGAEIRAVRDEDQALAVVSAPAAECISAVATAGNDDAPAKGELGEDGDRC